jgi:nucleotide-binding universal stress UspA family protein
MAFSKILCPTDFSPGSERALQVATRLARDNGAELVLLHAWHIPTAAYSLDAVFPPTMVEEVTDDAQNGLQAAVKRAAHNGASRATAKLVSGLPWAQIIEELNNHEYDVCVIGTHGRTGLARVLLGSVAEKVVRHAPCSVLVVHPTGEAGPFRHALAATDFSDSAAHAIDVATTLVEASGSISLLHVIEVPVVYAGELPIEDFAQDLDKTAGVALDTESARLKQMTTRSVDAQSRIGYPGAQILAALDNDPTVDLVVLGSHGRTGMKRVLLGSVAEKVVRHARCPVLVAHKRI